MKNLIYTKVFLIGLIFLNHTICLALLSLISQVEAKRRGGGFLLIIFTDENGNMSGLGLALLILSALVSFGCCFVYCYYKVRYERAKRQYEMQQQGLESRSNGPESNQPIHYESRQEEVSIPMPKGATGN